MRLKALMTMLALALFIGACGGDDDDGGDGGGGGDTVSAKAYAKDICTGTSDWVGGIQKLASDLGGAIPDDASPAEGKEALEGFLGDALDSTEKYVSAVEEAGVPDVEGGEEAATEIQDAVSEARDIMSEASAKTADLPTGDEQAFSREANKLGSSTRDSLSAVGDAIGDPPQELSKAFQDEPACSQIGAPGPG